MLNLEQYAIISDVHGCYDELVELNKLILDFDKKNKTKHKLISLGDLCDRGPKNVKTLEFWKKQIQNKDAIVIQGNHCNVLWEALSKNKSRPYPGLPVTINELNQLLVEQPKQYESLKNFWVSYWNQSKPFLVLDNGKLIVTHAGMTRWLADSYIFAGKFPSDDITKAICLYGANIDKYGGGKYGELGFWQNAWDSEQIVVYGHFVTKEVSINNNTWGIETGVVFGGKITALLYPEMKILQVNAKRKYW